MSGKKRPPPYWLFNRNKVKAVNKDKARKRPLNEGQERYAFEQRALAKVRRNHYIRHENEETLPDIPTETVTEFDTPPIETATADSILEQHVREGARRGEQRNKALHAEIAKQQTNPREEEKENNKDEHDSDNRFDSDDDWPDSVFDTAPETFDSQEYFTPPETMSAPGSGGKGRDIVQQQSKKRKNNNDETGDAGGGGGDDGASSSGGGGGNMYFVDRPFNGSVTHFRTFHKQLKAHTFGLAFVILEKTVAGNSVFYMTSPLAEIPVHKLALYLSPGEYDGLPLGTVVEHIHVKVVARNVQQQFQTNTSETTLATLNQNKDLIYAHGLNLTGYGANHFLTTTGTAPMVPTDIQAPIYESTTSPQYEGLQVDYYGKNSNASDFKTYVPKMCTGASTTLKNYWCFHQADTVEGGWAFYQKYWKQFNAPDAIGVGICEYNYKPQVAPIKKPLKYIYSGLPTGNRDTNLSFTGQHGPGAYRMTQSVTASNNVQSFLFGNREAGAISQGPPVSQGEIVNRSDNIIGTTDFNYDQPIEKSSFYGYGFLSNHLVKTQPSFHVGCMPAPALTTSIIDTNSSFVDLKTEFDISTTMTVSYKQYNDRAYIGTGADPWNLSNANDILVKTALPPTTGSATITTQTGSTYNGMYTNEIPLYA